MQDLKTSGRGGGGGDYSSPPIPHSPMENKLLIS